MWWLLTREVLYLRNAISRSQPWDVMVDLFLYRDPEETEQQLKESIEEGQPTIQNTEEWSKSEPTEEWTSTSWDNTIVTQTS